jgi:hypothetical protein
MKWLLVSSCFVGTLLLSSCSSTRLEPVQMSFSPAPLITSPAIITPEEDMDLDVLNKPLPELDEIEALLSEYSGTDVN